MIGWDEQRPADAEELEHAGDDEHLQQQPEQVDVAVKGAVGVADDCPRAAALASPGPYIAVALCTM
jgi:hypothetical protein